MAIQIVLLVDDDNNLRRLCQLSLCNVGKWEVLTASGGVEALEIARQRRPDIILLDVMMPGMDGPATLSQLRADENLSSIPVIFLTAKVQHHEIDQYIQLGALGVITKPFDPMTLPQDILRLVGSE